MGGGGSAIAMAGGEHFSSGAGIAHGGVTGGRGVVGTVTFLGRSALVWFGWGELIEAVQEGVGIGHTVVDSEGSTSIGCGENCPRREERLIAVVQGLAPSHVSVRINRRRSFFLYRNPMLRRPFFPSLIFASKINVPSIYGRILCSRARNLHSDPPLPTPPQIPLGRPIMGCVSLSTPRSKYSGALHNGDPPSSQIVGGPSEEDMVLGMQMSSRLAKRTGWPVFVSCGLNGLEAPGGAEGLEGFGGGTGGLIGQRMAALAEREVGKIILKRKQDLE